MDASTTIAPGEVSARQLRERLHRGDDLFMLDVRNPEEFERLKIEGRKPLTFLNIPYIDMLDEDTEDIAEAAKLYAQRQLGDKLPKGQPIGVICGKGNASAFIAEGLRRLDYDAISLAGGMGAWGDYYEFKSVVAGKLSVWQVIRPARGCLSYVVASGKDALILDPLRHEERYREFISEHDLHVVGEIGRAHV